MSELTLTARRTGDFESRTEEYELGYAVGDGPVRTLRVKYQAARAFEINASLDEAVETARQAIAEADPELASKPTDGSLAQFTWKAMQSVKYEEGGAKTSTLALR